MNENVSLIVRTVDKATGPLRKIGVAFAAMSNKAKANVKAVGAAAQYIGGAIGAAGVAGGVMAIRQAGNVASALGELESLGITKLQSLTKAGVDFSNSWAGTTTQDFLKAAYDIKSGISSLSDQGVADVTRVAALTAVATKAEVAQMTSLFATAHSIFKKMYPEKSDADFAAMFSGGLAASVQRFKTNGEGMQQAIESLGDTATAAKMPLQEQLALLGMMQSTMKGAEAGTKLRSFISSLAVAGEKLRLPFLDAQRNIRSTAEIIGLLRNEYGDTLDAIEKQKITEAFGRKEAVAVIDFFYQKTGQLREETKGLSRDMAQGTAVTEKMARVINDGPNEAFAILGQVITNVAAALGRGLWPVVKPAVDWLIGAGKAAQAWADANPELATTLYMVATILGLVVAGLGAASIAMLAFNGAVWANPVVWIVAGIVAALVVLGGAIWWVAKHWDQVVAFISELFWGLVDLVLDVAVKLFWPFVLAGWGMFKAWAALWGLLKEPLSAFWRWAVRIFGQLWDHIVSSAGDFGSKLWAALTALVSGLLDIFAANPFVQVGVNLVMGIWEGIKSGWGLLTGWVASQVDALVGWMPDWMKERMGIGGLGKSAGGAAPLNPAAARPGEGQRSRFMGKVQIDVNAPRGTRIRRAEKSGDAEVDLFAGLTNIGNW